MRNLTLQINSKINVLARFRDLFEGLSGPYYVRGVWGQLCFSKPEKSHIT